MELNTDTIILISAVASAIASELLGVAPSRANSISQLIFQVLKAALDARKIFRP